MTHVLFTNLMRNSSASLVGAIPDQHPLIGERPFSMHARTGRTWRVEVPHLVPVNFVISHPNYHTFEQTFRFHVDEEQDPPTEVLITQVVDMSTPQPPTYHPDASLGVLNMEDRDQPVIHGTGTPRGWVPGFGMPDPRIPPGDMPDPDRADTSGRHRSNRVRVLLEHAIQSFITVEDSLHAQTYFHEMSKGRVAAIMVPRDRAVDIKTERAGGIVDEILGAVFTDDDNYISMPGQPRDRPADQVLTGRRAIQL